MTAPTLTERRRDRRGAWPLERVLFALAGTVTLLSAVLTLAVSQWFVVLAALVGVNQWAFVLLGACPASVVLRHTCGLRSAVYPPVDGRETQGVEVMV